jgi:hypothetical protein
LISLEGKVLHSGKIGPLSVSFLSFAEGGRAICATTTTEPYLVQGREAFTADGANWSACIEKYLYLDPGEYFVLLDARGAPISKIPRVRWVQASLKSDLIAIGGIEGSGVIRSDGNKIFYDDDWFRYFVENDVETGSFGTSYYPIGRHDFRLLFSPERAIFGAIRRGRLSLHDFEKGAKILETEEGYYSHAGILANGEVLAFRREVPQETWIQWINRFLQYFPPEPPIPGRLIRFREGREVFRSRLYDDIAAIHYLPCADSAARLLTTDGVRTATLREPDGRPVFARELDGVITSVDADSDSGLIALCTASHTLWLFHEDGTLEWSKKNIGDVLKVKFLPGAGLVAGCADGKVLRLSKSGEPVWTVDLSPLAWSPGLTGPPADSLAKTPELPFWENLGEEATAFEKSSCGKNIAREKGVRAMEVARGELFPRFSEERLTNGLLSDSLPDFVLHKKRGDELAQKGKQLPYFITMHLGKPREIAFIAIYDGDAGSRDFVTEYRIEIHSREGWKTAIQVRGASRPTHYHPLRASGVDSIRYTIGLSSDGLPRCAEIEIYEPR